MNAHHPSRLLLRDLVLELATLQDQLRDVIDDQPTCARRVELLQREEQIIDELRALGPGPNLTSRPTTEHPRE